MVNTLTGGKAKVGSLEDGAGGGGSFTLRGTVARTDVTAKQLFTIPANSYVQNVSIEGTASDAGTSATVDVTQQGGGSADFAAFNVGVASNPSGVSRVALLVDGGDGGTTTVVTATYTETGSASTTGGPWTVAITYHY